MIIIYLKEEIDKVIGIEEEDHKEAKELNKQTIKEEEIEDKEEVEQKE